MSDSNDFSLESVLNAIESTFDDSILHEINASFELNEEENLKLLNDLCWISLAAIDAKAAIAAGPVSYESLAKTLNHQRHKTPQNNDWTPQKVKHLCGLYELEPSLERVGEGV